MNVNLIDTDNAVNDNYASIINFIIDAVVDYPDNNSDLDSYLQEIKKILNSDIITEKVLTEYLNNYRLDNENVVWVETSISAMREAIKLVDFFKIDFTDVIAEMNRLVVKA